MELTLTLPDLPLWALLAMAYAVCGLGTFMSTARFADSEDAPACAFFGFFWPVTWLALVIAAVLYLPWKLARLGKRYP